MQDQTVERRSLRRHVLRVPIRIEHVGNGMTRDVSANGVAFEIDSVLTVGSQIRFAMVFSGHALRLFCVGRVVRIDRIGERSVAAAIIDWIEHLITERPSGGPERLAPQITSPKPADRIGSAFVVGLGVPKSG